MMDMMEDSSDDSGREWEQVHDREEPKIRLTISKEPINVSSKIIF
jgi:hypothetical protein